MLPHMITVVSLAVLLALLKLLARRRKLPELPLRLSLLALLIALGASTLPAAWLPPPMRPWLVSLDELLVGLVLIRLVTWALLEAPPASAGGRARPASPGTSPCSCWAGSTCWRSCSSRPG